MLDVEKATDAEEAAWKLAELELRGRYGKVAPGPGITAGLGPRHL